jgi:hypothetical protein
VTPAARLARRFVAALREPAPFTWRGDLASFELEGTLFEVAFKGKSIRHPKYGAISGFEVSFYRKADKGAPWQYKPTGEGNPFRIFATVNEVVKDFLIKRKPSFLWFVADEPTRVRLYNKLLQKLVVPGYEAEVTDDGKYTLRRTKSVFDP